MMSGAKAGRPGLQAAFAFVRAGDAMIVWRPDCLGCSLKALVQKVEDLQQRRVGFCSLHESIDTTRSVGKLQFHVFSALVEFGRDLICDGTMAGLRTAYGRLGGPPAAHGRRSRQERHLVWCKTLKFRPDKHA
jgi:DNA invertase Pin-like site-specific DNA recombinase